MQFETNPFNIQIETLGGPTPSENVLYADERSLLERAQVVLDQARAHAQTILREAHEEAARIRTEAARLGETEKEVLIHQTQDDCVRRGLQWLVGEAQLEITLVDRVEMRVRNILALVLREWIDKQDVLTQLTHWLAAQVRDRAQAIPYRIRLHPDDLDALVTRLTQQDAPEGINYMADTGLAQGQAVIDTEFLRIEFDLARHWKQVLAALRRSSAPEPD